MPLPAASRAAASDHALAREVAEEAGAMLVRLRAELEGAGLWPPDVGDEGDRQAHHLIVDRLRRERPDDAVLSEEGWDDRARLHAERVWIVDPVDGTREFSEPGRSDWAVHVALVVDGDPVAGAVALPARSLTLATDAPPALPQRHPGPPRLVVSRSRPPHQALRVRDALGGTLLPLGSAGAKAMAVVLGEADAYVHAGGQYEWDSCAPAAVAAAAGLHVSRLDGSPLVYNRPDPWLPDLLVCRPELADDVLTAIHG